MTLYYDNKIAKLKVFSQKYITCIITNYQSPMQNNKNLVTKIDKEAFI